MSKQKRKSVQKIIRTRQKEKMITLLRVWFTKNWLILLATIASVVAVVISVKSCRIQDKAYETSKEQFFQENKPYVILKPVKYSKLQSYYKYEPLPEENAVRMEVQFQMKNIGKAAAKELAVFDELKLNQPSIPKYLDLPLSTILGPDQEYILTMKTTTGWKNKESYEEFVQKLSSEKGPEITIRMGVTYLSELNPEQSFSSAIVTKLTKQSAQIVKMEYEDEGHLIDVENR